jgi:Ser/Thr protein kinase RdoA (MazF antagonist)
MTVQLIDLLKTHYGIDAVTVQPLSGGMMNQNFTVQTAEQTYVLKSYAMHLYKPAWIEQTCEAQELISAAGVPVPRVIRTQAGELLCQTENGFYLLNEFVAGHQHVRMKIPAKAAYEMGRTLGRMLEAFRAREDVTPYVLPATDQVVEKLTSLLQEAERRRASKEVDEAIAQLLRYKLDALERLPDLPAQLEDLPTQWVHGDYHEGNVIFDVEDRVAAVIDFDNLRCRPRGQEVMRTVLICFYDGEQLAPEAYDFLAGYVEEVEVSAEEVATYAPLITYMGLIGDWPMSVRYETPEAYDPRWDRLIDPPTGWWERHMDEVTERLLAVLAAKAAKSAKVGTSI